MIEHDRKHGRYAGGEVDHEPTGRDVSIAETLLEEPEPERRGCAKGQSNEKNSRWRRVERQRVCANGTDTAEHTCGNHGVKSNRQRLGFIAVAEFMNDAHGSETK